MDRSPIERGKKVLQFLRFPGFSRSICSSIAKTYKELLKIKILSPNMDFSKIAVLFYPFLSWICGCLSDLYTTYYVDLYYITYHVIDIPMVIDYVIIVIDLMLHRCRDRDKENWIDPR